MKIDLSNRRVLVTGASRGIGLSVAHRFAEANADLILLSEDNALALGAGLLFAILAAIMVATRRVDWYQLSGRGIGGRF